MLENPALPLDVIAFSPLTPLPSRHGAGKSRRRRSDMVAILELNLGWVVTTPSDRKASGARGCDEGTNSLNFCTNNHSNQGSPLQCKKARNALRPFVRKGRLQLQQPNRVSYGEFKPNFCEWFWSRFWAMVFDLVASKTGFATT